VRLTLSAAGILFIRPAPAEEIKFSYRLGKALDDEATPESLCSLL
jgi:hypothetical protein